MFCPVCGKQSAPTANFCSACGASALPAPSAPRTRIVRPRSPRMIAGVCSGIAIHFGWNVAAVRILFALFAIVTHGFGLFCYVVAWILLPDAQYALPREVQYATPIPGSYAGGYTPVQQARPQPPASHGQGTTA